jgi:RNA polymerase sigma factor (sigma-70 family)
MNTGIKHPKPRILLRKNINKLINDAMRKLPEADYDILYELYFKHTSIHQLSKNLGISRAGVRWRRDKALKHLKEIIGKEVKNFPCTK